MSRKSKIFASFLKITGILFGSWFLFSWIYSSFSTEINYDTSHAEIIEDDNSTLELNSEERDAAKVNTYKGPEINFDSIIHPGDEFLSGNFYTHEHTWKDSDQQEYKANFQVNQEYFDSCYCFRESINSLSSYPRIYHKMVEYDVDKLEELLEMYEAIKDEKDLDQKEFADMVVTSIQNIPYVLVHEYTHEKAEELWGESFEEYHASGEPCLDKIKFGVQSPVEFMSNFQGDCDTRALLCYLILKEFGFKVAMLGSTEYGHEVLGISGNYRGCFVKKDGIKYYAWETTAIGYTPGVMSPDWSNMDHWSVDIASTD